MTIVSTTKPFEAKAMFRALQVEGGHSSPKHSRELEEMIQILRKDEQILAGAATHYARGIEAGMGTIFITNQRVVILNKGFLWGLKSLSVNLSSINSVELKSGFALSCLSFRDTAVKYKADNLDKPYARHMAQLLSDLV